MSEPLWLQQARELVGLEEIVGSRHEAKILQFFAEAGHSYVRDDETPWCSAMVGACLARAGEANTGSLAARSYETYGQSIVEENASVGDIAVFWRGSPTSWQGHVAFFLRFLDDKVEVLGGNQANKVSITTYPRSRLVAIRRPGVASLSAEYNPSAFSEEVRAVQQQLWAKGYRMVGSRDGRYGRFTRDALNAFRADNGLQQYDTNIITDADRARLLTADSRVIGEARAGTTLNDLRKSGSRTVKNGSRGIAAVAVTAVTTVTGYISQGSEIVETTAVAAEDVTAASEKLPAIVEFAATMWPYLAIAGFIAAGVFIWLMLRARQDDARTGKTS
jgi:uncharacterized protein (TIGR02594 family)